jgi:arylsulfatase A-like enzyme
LLKNKVYENFNWEFHEKSGSQAVRMGKWKGVRVNMSNNTNAPIELYDLSTDPIETKNIANSYSEIVANIAKIMKDAHIENDRFKFGYETK